MDAEETVVHQHGSCHMEVGFLNLSNPLLRFLKIRSLITHLGKLKWPSSAGGISTGDLDFLEIQKQAPKPHDVQRSSTAPLQCELRCPNPESLLNPPHYCDPDKELKYGQVHPKEWSHGREGPVCPCAGEGVAIEQGFSENVLNGNKYLLVTNFDPISQQVGQVKPPTFREPVAQKFGLVFYPPLFIGIGRKPGYLPDCIHTSPLSQLPPRECGAFKTLKSSFLLRRNTCATRDQTVISIPRGHKAYPKAVTWTSPSSKEHIIPATAARTRKTRTRLSTSLLRRSKISNLVIVGSKQPRMAPSNLYLNGSSKTHPGYPGKGFPSILSRSSKGILSPARGEEFHKHCAPQGNKVKSVELT